MHQDYHRTEPSYCQWLRRFIFFHNVRHLTEIDIRIVRERVGHSDGKTTIAYTHVLNRN